MRLLLAALLLAGALHAEGLMDQALNERRQGRLDESILTLQKLIKAEPDNSRAWYELGLSYASDAQYPKAVDAYRLALARGFEEGQCLCALALALRESHKPVAALSQARHCLDRMPGYAGAWNLIGNVEIDLGHFIEARAAYRKALELKPSYANAHFNLAVAHESLNHEGDAEAAYRTALRLEPGMQDAWLGLGNCLLRQNKPEEARKAFEAALKLNDGLADAEWGLARAWNSLGEKGKSSAHEASYRRILRENDRRRNVAMNRKQQGAAMHESEAWDRETRERKQH